MHIARTTPAVIEPAAHWQPAGFVLLAVVVGLALVGLPWWAGAALIGGTAVLLLVLIQPLIGLALALMLGPWGALENVVLGNALFDSGQLMLLLTLAAWLARGLRRRRLLLPQTFLLWPLLLFLGVTLLSLLNASSVVHGLRELLKWVEIGLIIWLVADVSREYGRRKVLIWLLAMLLLAGLSQALIGIWQFGLRGDGPEHFLILGSFYRAYGTFEQPNPFGGFMHLTALLALGTLLGLLVVVWQRLVQERAAALPAWPLIGVAGAAAVFASVALVLSWSRGAWLSFAVGTAVLVFFWPRRRWQGVLLIGAGVLGLLVAAQLNLLPASVLDRLVGFGQDLRFGDVRGVDINDANYAVLERLAHWQAALDMGRDNVWLGVGFGNYEPAYADYALINWPDALGHAHNYYLNLLAEAGILGLLGYGIFWTAVFYQSVRALRQKSWFQRGIVLGLLACWAALSVHHLVDKLYVNNIYVHLGVMLGLLQLLDSGERHQGAFGNAPAGNLTDEDLS